MTATLPAVSREYLYVENIAAFSTLSPDAAGDPTALPVQFAFLPAGTDPIETDWTDGEWVDQTTARILTGTGGTWAPATGTYAVWLRVTGALEQPERHVGYLTVT